ncbi:MAG TPA: hypothetical protein VEI73_14405 [Candidatus Acidoferrum sp.]|nr:hypothetical protein [Candidatus Acidoferrum sp.]
MKTEIWRRAGSGRASNVVLAILLLFAGARPLSAAQDLPDAPKPKPEAIPCALAGQSQQGGGCAPQANTQPDAKDKDARDNVPKRILFIIPNFMTANDQPENQGPLTPAQKFNIAWHQYSDYSAHFGNLLQAGISQAANGIPHFGQGWGAFGERFLAEEGDQMTGSMLIYGVLPTVLHQDPRYLRRGRGSALSRIYYAASRVLIARTDEGTSTFNSPQVFGQLGQAAISLSYYPRQDHSMKGLFQGWGVNQLYNIGWNQLKEFTPDLGAFIRRHHRKKNAPDSAISSAN